jgi:hypothetical protein
MAITQEDIDALELAIASGAKKVKFSDRETEYRDLAEMKEILNRMKAALNGTKRRPYLATSYRRGYQ